MLHLEEILVGVGLLAVGGILIVLFSLNSIKQPVWQGAPGEMHRIEVDGGYIYEFKGAITFVPKQ